MSLGSSSFSCVTIPACLSGALLLSSKTELMVVTDDHLKILLQCVIILYSKKRNTITNIFNSYFEIIKLSNRITPAKNTLSVTQFYSRSNICFIFVTS